MELKKIAHPGEKHDLSYEEGILPLSQTCHKCWQPVSREYYKFTAKGCDDIDEYYLHKECTELKNLSQEYHPLHPQHRLATIKNNNFPYFKSFICSFCRKTCRRDQISAQCSDDQCDFTLHYSCARDFLDKPELLNKYEIDQHFLHNHENHRLSPYRVERFHYDSSEEIFLQEYGSEFLSPNYCALCKGDIFRTKWVFKCTGCNFSLHVECSQVPEEVVNHNSHPQHPLVLLSLQNQNTPAASESDEQEEEKEEGESNSKLQQLCCIACLQSMKESYLNCTHCPTFNLDLQCYFRFQTEPTVKHEAHEHPLAYFQRIYDNDVRCYACNTPCVDCLFRCFTCNFNIHSDCLALPNTVEYDDHLHPLTLTTSFKEDEHPTAYYCDICEKKRDPDRGIYFCEECPFIAHFECALSLSIAEEAAYAHAPWHQKLSDEEDQEDMTLTNEKVCVEILDQLNEEIKKVREVIEQIFIKKREGEQPTEKLQEFEERRANTEDILRRLKQSVTATELD